MTAGLGVTLMKAEVSMRWGSWFMFIFGLNLEQIMILTSPWDKWNCDITMCSSGVIYSFIFSQVSDCSHTLVGCWELHWAGRGADHKAGTGLLPTVFSVRPSPGPPHRQPLPGPGSQPGSSECSSVRRRSPGILFSFYR